MNKIEKEVHKKMNLTIVWKEFGRVLKRNCNSQWTDSFYYCILKLWHVTISPKKKIFLLMNVYRHIWMIDIWHIVKIFRSCNLAIFIWLKRNPKLFLFRILFEHYLIFLKYIKILNWIFMQLWFWKLFAILYECSNISSNVYK